MHHKMPRHEDRLPHDELDFHRAYPDSHNVPAHAMINRRGLDGALQASRLRKNSVYTQYTIGIFHIGADGNKAAGCSKWPDFSPAQPRRAETRHSAGKAAASEEARRTLRYVEPLSDARTKLADFFSILLEGMPLDRWQSGQKCSGWEN